MKKHVFQLIRLAFAVLLLCLSMGQSMNAISAVESSTTTRYAKPEGRNAGYCLSWEKACDLQHALEISVKGDAIWAMEGIYYPGSVVTDTFQLKDGVALYGGFPAGGGDWIQRNWNAHLTILSGDIDHNDLAVGGVVTDTVNITGTNAYQVVTNESGTTAILDGFTITAGNANRIEEPKDKGGGLFNRGNLFLANTTFSGNRAIWSGGGMFNEGTSTITDVIFMRNHANTTGGGLSNYPNGIVTLTRVTLSDNSTDWIGGGLFNNDTATLTNVTFSGNTATNSGGGMFNQFNGSAMLVDVTFSSNSAGRGGGMVNTSGTIVLTDVIFSNNSALAGGGGILNQGAATITDVIFSNNSTGGDGGGGMLSNGGTVELDKVTFSNNTTTGWGGGMYLYGTASLTNISFSYNSALDCGGIYVWAGNPSLINVTFYENSATRLGGGMCSISFGTNGSHPTLTNAIFWHNSPYQIFTDELSTANATYSDIQGGWNGEGNIDKDPLLGPLAHNSGFTLSHALGEGSPAIDSGNPGICPPTDQRDWPRPMDGDRDGTPVCDMGAFEFIPYQIFLPQMMK